MAPAKAAKGGKGKKGKKVSKELFRFIKKTFILKMVARLLMGRSFVVFIGY